MTPKQITLAILIPLVVVAIIIFGVYIFGYIYNTLVKRRRLALNSWRELTKVLTKEFNYIPVVMKSISMDEQTREKLAFVYKEYKALNLIESSPETVSRLYIVLTSCLDKLQEENNKSEVLEFINESMRLSSFSIPLYNHNVRKYIRMKSKPINRSVAKAFGFEEIKLFEVNRTAANNTMDLRLKKFTIKQGEK